jgi:hypothetical protein
LPPSVLFWERRVYWAPVLLVVTAFRQGRSPDFTFQRLKLLWGPWRSTINRWRRYFTELFAESAVFRRVSGRLMPPVAADRLPRSLLERFCSLCDEPCSALVTCLKLLASGP